MRYLLPCLLLAGVVFGGGLSDWDAARPLPWKTFRHRAVTVGRRIYVLGGWHRPFGWTTEVDADGELAPWQRLDDFPEMMPADFGAAAVAGNLIYWLGGRRQDPETNEHEDSPRVYFARVREDGGLSAWQETTPMPEGRLSGAAFVHAGRLYYVGGQYRRQVWFAAIQEDGGLGPWQESAPLTSPRGGSVAVLYDDYLFILGGMVLHRQHSNLVFRTHFTADGGIARWRRSEPLPLALAGAAGVALDRDVFLFGGGGNETGVLAAGIGEDRHFAEWRRLAPLPAAVTNAAAVAVDDFIFLIGGIRHGEEQNHVYENVWRCRRVTARAGIEGERP